MQIGTSNFAKHDERFPFKYRAKVLDNTDSENLGRIKAQVYPMFAKITDATTLPWAVPEFPLGSGAGNGYGVFSVPEIGSWVWVFFEMGDIYQPVYGGAAPTRLSGLPDDRTTNYPSTKVYRTKNGIQVTINDYNSGGSDQRLYRIDHPSGTVIELLPDGNVMIKTDKKDITLFPKADVNLKTEKTRMYGNAYVDSGASDTFTSADGKLVSVAAGIVISIK
jgi:hypothetical protein